MVSRAQPQDTPRELLDAILKAPVSNLPALVGVDLGEQGYAIAKVIKVGDRDPVAADAARAQGQYAQAWADAEAQAYYAALRQRFNVQISAAPAAVDTAASAPK
jgi:peptidyl-prolyl cis-trans isomerase D